MGLIEITFESIVIDTKTKLDSIQFRTTDTEDPVLLLNELEDVMGLLDSFLQGKTVGDCMNGISDFEYEILTDTCDSLGPYSDSIRVNILERIKVSRFKLLNDVTANTNIQEAEKFQELRERLTTYISITTEDLKKLIEGQSLQKGAAKWIGKPIEAYRFAYWLNPKGTERHKNFKAFFNNNIAGVKVHGNQSKGLVLGLEGSIWDILKQYRPTKEID